MTTQIRSVDPGDTVALERWYDLLVTTGPYDVEDFPRPSRPHHMRRYEHPWPTFDSESLLVWDGDEVIGAASLLMGTQENRTNASLELVIHPDHRRRGHGTRLFREACAVARRHGRTTIGFVVAVPVDGGVRVDGGGAAFAATLAEKPATTDVRRRWVPGSSTDHAALAADAWTHADGYELRHWTGGSPDDAIDGIAALESRLLLDAPTGDLVVEQEVFDVDRMRAMEATRIARGARLYTTVAIHVASGDIVATTTMTVDADITDHAWQQITIVDPAHRGHRLGLLVKLANLAYVREREPEVTVIDTFNSAENTFMIAVNEQMGFRPTEAWLVYQIPTPEA
jgi:GNAT superfamily N-acetyltransferase